MHHCPAHASLPLSSPHRRVEVSSHSLFGGRVHAHAGARSHPSTTGHSSRRAVRVVALSAHPSSQRLSDQLSTAGRFTPPEAIFALLIWYGGYAGTRGSAGEEHVREHAAQTTETCNVSAVRSVDARRRPSTPSLPQRISYGTVTSEHSARGAAWSGSRIGGT